MSRQVAMIWSRQAPLAGRLLQQLTKINEVLDEDEGWEWREEDGVVQASSSCLAALSIIPL